MNFTNIIKYETKEAAEKEIRCKEVLEEKLKTKDEIINKLNSIIGISIARSIGSEIYVTYISKMIVSYEDENGKLQYNSVYENLIDKEFLMNDLLVDMKRNQRSLIYSVLFSYYFDLSNYKKVLEILKLLENEDASYVSFNINSFYSIPVIDMMTGSKRNLLILYGYSKYAHSKNENIKGINKEFLEKYLSSLRSISSANLIEEYFKDKMILMMHEKVMHDYLERGKIHSIEGKHSPLTNHSLLDKLETNPDFLIKFINNFKSSMKEEYWGKIDSREDYRIQCYLKELDSEKERLVKIFKNFLYSKYALGQKYSGLEDIISRMSSMLNILGYDEYSVMDIIDGLPDKIQTAALKAFVGE